MERIESIGTRTKELKKPIRAQSFTQREVQFLRKIVGVLGILEVPKGEFRKNKRTLPRGARKGFMYKGFNRRHGLFLDGDMGADMSPVDRQQGAGGPFSRTYAKGYADRGDQKEKRNVLEGSLRRFGGEIHGALLVGRKKQFNFRPTGLHL